MARVTRRDKRDKTVTITCASVLCTKRNRITATLSDGELSVLRRVLTVISPRLLDKIKVSPVLTMSLDVEDKHGNAGSLHYKMEG